MSSITPQPHRTFKVLLIGDKSVGKTSAIIGFATNSFPRYLPSMPETQTVNMLVDEKYVVLNLVDTEDREEEEARSQQREKSYPGADCILLCFSVASPQSFSSIGTKWMKEVKSHTQNTRCILVGMKADLREDATTIAELSTQGLSFITTQTARAYAEEIGCWKYCEVATAEDQRGLKQLFEAVARMPECRHGESTKPEKKECVIL